jgi:UDP-N-acetylmuramyl pentapeptide phosphotransferase/UDP-N-acetylglucosamine-1-phosphate transferase
VLGLLDDVLGSGGDGRGFRGHLTAMRRGRLTTGGLKLLGGTAIALVIASSGPGDGVVQVLIDALVIALAANLANLLDRAPGRVLKAGAAAGVVLGVLTALDPGLAGLAVALGALLALLWADLRENLMIGDTGANVLGAALGVGLVLTAPVGARAGALAVLVVLNLLSEVVSFSSVIDRVPPLRWLDRAGRATA